MKYEFMQYCKENKKTVFLVLAATLAIIIGQLFSYLQGSKRYIADDSGQVVAISRERVDEELSLAMEVEAIKKGKATKEEIILSFSGKVEESSKAKSQGAKDAEIKAELQSIADEISQSEKKMVPLPKATETGVQLKWKRSGDTAKLLLLILLAPVVLFFLFRGREDAIHKKQEERIQSIRRGLPALNSQLLLLLNSGLIFNDAFLRIANSYERRSKRTDFLRQVVLAIMARSEKTNISLVLSLDEEAKTLGIKEFSRMAGIILDNQYKGVNLIEKLDNESQLLWNQRKKTAEEKGKLAETKLAFPLALLLIVLIIVTAAPAILQI